MLGQDVGTTAIFVLPKLEGGKLGVFEGILTGRM